jgi:hypothetical protein
MHAFVSLRGISHLVIGNADLVVVFYVPGDTHYTPVRPPPLVSRVVREIQRERILETTDLKLLGRAHMKTWNRGLRGTISLPVLALSFATIAHGQGNQSATPPGLFITPTALANAVQQDLNPGLVLPYFATRVEV